MSKQELLKLVAGTTVIRIDNGQLGHLVPYTKLPESWGIRRYNDNPYIKWVDGSITWIYDTENPALEYIQLA